MIVPAPISPSLKFPEAIKICFKGYVKFSGRGRRSEFWWFYLLCFIINAIFFGIFWAIAGDYLFYYYYYYYRYNLTKYYVALVIYLILDIAMLIPLLAASTRRLHDIGYSGFFNFLLLVPFANFSLLYFWSLDSQPGANIYGPATKYNVSVNAPLIPGGVQVVQPIIAYPGGQPTPIQPQVVSPQPNAYQGEVQNNQGVQNINQIGEQNTGNINQVPQQYNPNEAQTIPVAQPNNYTPIENQDNNLD